MIARQNLLLLLLLGAGALVFLDRSSENGRKANTDITKTDQGAYIKYAIALRESDFSYVGRRNRMPAYPALLACFMGKGENPDSFFETGKRINLGLTLAGLAFLAVIFLKAFPWHHGLNLLFLTAFTVFAFKAAYVQAEILYYLLSFAAFLLCWSLFRQPRVSVAILAGAVLGIAHLTKASVLPGLAIFLIFYLLDVCWQLGRRRDMVRPFTRLAVCALIAVTFLTTIFPYLVKSKEIYGRYFYNVNSTFYMWCESWADAENRTKAAGDRRGWPDLPAEEIPSLRNYLRTHNAAEIAGRIFTGISRVFNAMAGSFGYLWFCLSYLLFALWVVFQKRRVLWTLFRRRPMPVLAVISCFVGYYLLFAWYSQIIQGNRFVLSLYLPVMFAVSVFLVTFARRLRIRPGANRPGIPALTAFNTVIAVWLAVEIAINCLYRLPTLYGGN